MIHDRAQIVEQSAGRPAGLVEIAAHVRRRGRGDGDGHRVDGVAGLPRRRDDPLRLGAQTLHRVRVLVERVGQAFRRRVGVVQLGPQHRRLLLSRLRPAAVRPDRGQITGAGDQLLGRGVQAPGHLLPDLGRGVPRPGIELEQILQRQTTHRPTPEPPRRSSSALAWSVDR